MRTLHVAALPFPSPQGTQALIHTMLSALGRAGHDTHLFCYAHGMGERAGPYTVHRSRVRSRSRSLRSGPSLEKLALDAALAWELRALVDRVSPAVIVAHHVEAALCALAVARVPVVFVAHTSLADELPSYFPTRLAPLLRSAGGALDRGLASRAACTLTISPWLAHTLAPHVERRVLPLVLPWPCAPVATEQERAEARRQLALTPEHEVALYAGNLDGYQGLDVPLAALGHLARRRPQLRLLVATASAAESLVARAASLDLGARMQIVPLHDEADRRRVYAACDVALVPRATAGGVSIKLLDTLARATPCIADERALGGLTLAPYCSVLAADAPDAWEHALLAIFSDPSGAQARACAGRAYLARAHGDDAFVASFLAAVGR